MSTVRFRPLAAALLSATLLTSAAVTPALAGVPGSKSAINLDKTFLGNPKKYMPEFGGFCAGMVLSMLIGALLGPRMMRW